MCCIYVNPTRWSCKKTCYYCCNCRRKMKLLLSYVQIISDYYDCMMLAMYRRYMIVMYRRYLFIVFTGHELCSEAEAGIQEAETQTAAAVHESTLAPARRPTAAVQRHRYTARWRHLQLGRRHTLSGTEPLPNTSLLRYC